MALFSLTAAADALDDLLDQERRMILSGQIDGLVRVSGDKDRLLARLPGAGDGTEVLDRLRAKADRNQKLLAAAARGLKSASRRGEALNTSTNNLRTYGRNGAAVDLTNAPGGFNRRA